MGRVLVACEFSGIVSGAFRARGHEAYSCDLLDTEGHPQWHFKGDVTNLLHGGWDLVIAHPPCTFLTNAGVRHLDPHNTSVNGIRAAFSGERRKQAAILAANFFNLFKNSAPHVCIENPIPHSYAKAMIDDYSQLLYPYEYGDSSVKPVCLWLQDLPKLVPTKALERPNLKAMTRGEKRKWSSSSHPQNAERAKNRSRFFLGVADAMAEQWGPLLPPSARPSP